MQAVVRLLSSASHAIGSIGSERLSLQDSASSESPSDVSLPSVSERRGGARAGGGGGLRDLGEEDEDIESPVHPLLRRQGTSVLGTKTISLFGSIVLIVNNVSGPGMLALPQVFQQSGWVLPVATFAVICVVSSLSATLLADAMSAVPGNDHRFGKRVEFACVFDEFYGAKAKKAVLLAVCLCLLSQVLSSIVATAQVVDSFVVFLSPNATTYALQLQPFALVSWTPPSPRNTTIWPGGDPSPQGPNASLPVALLPQDCHGGDAVPFQGEGYGPVVTLGYVITALTIAPMGLFNLEESITGQVISFWMLLLFSGEFLWQFWAEGLDPSRVPAFGESYSGMLGSVVFNYAFIVTIPSWLNEKREDVSVNAAVWLSTISSTVLYLVIGIWGAMAYQNVEGNFLNSLASHCNPQLTRVSAFMFASGIVAMSVPVFVIMIRYNLIMSGACSDAAAVWWTAIGPFTVSWLLYRGNLFNEVVNWSGQFLNGPVNFLLPLLLSLTAVGASRRFPPLLPSFPGHDLPAPSRPTSPRQGAGVWPLSKLLSPYHVPLVRFLVGVVLVLVGGAVVASVLCLGQGDASYC